MTSTEGNYTQQGSHESVIHHVRGGFTAYGFLALHPIGFDNIVFSKLIKNIFKH